MNKIIKLENYELWCKGQLDSCKNPFGVLQGKGIQYRQGYKAALESTLKWVRQWNTEMTIPSEYAVDIRDIEKKFDEAAKDENLAPIVRLAVGTAKHIILNGNDNCMPIA